MRANRNHRFDGSTARRSGSTLVMAVVVLTALLVFGLAAMRLGMSSNRKALASNDDRKAMAMAEAGLCEAMDAVRAGGNGQLGGMDAPVAMGDGLFWVDAVDVGSNRVQLVSTGMVGSGRSAVEVVVRRPTDESPLFDTVINSKKGLSMASSTFSDSFQSKKGTYASQAVNVLNGQTYAGTEGSLRSNGNLSVGGYVFGDATPGPGKSVSVSSGAYLYGSDAPAQNIFTFPPIEFPPIPQGGDYLVPASGSAVLPSGDYGFANFEIGTGATLRIEGPAVFLVDNVDVLSNSSLEIDARLGPVSFYCRNTYDQKAGFQVKAVADSPIALAFLIDGQAKFGNASVIRGGYYAPNTNVTLSPDSEVFGAMAADGFTMASGVRFHYDEDLEDYFREDTGQGGTQSVSLLAWFEREVQPTSLRINRGDPYEVLGLSRQDAMTPDAARQQDLINAQSTQ